MFARFGLIPEKVNSRESNGKMEKIHNEELPNLNSLPSIINGVLKS
jgi:hypothetical protein